jgi:hypothetical protein
LGRRKGPQTSLLLRVNSAPPPCLRRDDREARVGLVARANPMPSGGAALDACVSLPFTCGSRYRSPVAVRNAHQLPRSSPGVCLRPRSCWSITACRPLMYSSSRCPHHAEPQPGDRQHRNPRRGHLQLWRHSHTGGYLDHRQRSGQLRATRAASPAAPADPSSRQSVRNDGANGRSYPMVGPPAVVSGVEPARAEPERAPGSGELTVKTAESSPGRTQPTGRHRGAAMVAARNVGPPASAGGCDARGVVPHTQVGTVAISGISGPLRRAVDHARRATQPSFTDGSWRRLDHLAAAALALERGAVAYRRPRLAARCCTSIPSHVGAA